MIIQVSFRVLHTGPKKPKAPHALNDICHNLLGYLNKKVKECTFCYPPWNAEEPLDRVALVRDRAECRGLPSDRLWIFIGMPAPPKPPKTFVCVKSLDGPLLVEGVGKYGVERLMADEAVGYIPTLPRHGSLGRKHGGEGGDESKEQCATASSLEDPAHAEALMALLPEVIETVQGVLGDSYRDLPQGSKGIGSGMAAMASVVSHLATMKEGGQEWGEGTSVEGFKEDSALGAMVGIASSLVLKAQGLNEREAKRALKHLITKEGRLDGSRRLEFKDKTRVEFFTGHRSLWIK
jgi:hypothetical protein